MAELLRLRSQEDDECTTVTPAETQIAFMLTPWARFHPRRTECMTELPRKRISVKTRCRMNSEHVKGAADKSEGNIKEATGHVIGSKKLENEGKVDKVKGAVHNAAGNAKDAIKGSSTT